MNAPVEHVVGRLLLRGGTDTFVGTTATRADAAALPTHHWESVSSVASGSFFRERPAQPIQKFVRPGALGLWQVHTGKHRQAAALIDGSTTFPTHTSTHLQDPVHLRVYTAACNVLYAFDTTPRQSIEAYAFDPCVLIECLTSTEDRSPFDYLDAENSTEVPVVLDEVLRLPRSDAQQIQQRLTHLFRLSKEAPDQRVMAPESLHFFVEFLKRHQGIRRPLLFLRESGLVTAEWRVSPRRGLSITFRSDGSTEYVAFAPSKRRRSNTLSKSADNVSWQDVLEDLQSTADLTWLWNGSAGDP